MARIQPVRPLQVRPLQTNPGRKGWWKKGNKPGNPATPPPLPNRPPPRPRQRPTDVTRESSIASDRDIGLDVEELLYWGETGRWVDVLSTYLNRIRFDWASKWGSGPPWPPGAGERRKGYLTIEFLDLAIVEYPGETYKTFEDLMNSPSKGYYMWYGSSGLQHKPGNKIRDAQRTVTPAMKEAREPWNRRHY